VKYGRTTGKHIHVKATTHKTATNKITDNAQAKSKNPEAVAVKKPHCSEQKWPYLKLHI
jgi:hypothetical protein